MRSASTRSKSMAELLKLRRKARQGNQRAINSMIKRNEKMARRANRMLDTLAKHGRTKMAYASAQNFIYSAYGGGVTRYKTDLKDPNAIYQQMLSIEHFLSLKTSTLVGARHVDSIRIAAFRAKFPEQTKGMKNKQILDFFTFLSEESIDAYLNESSQYGSGDEIDSFLYAVNQEGRQFDKIIEAVEHYNETFNNPSTKESENFYYDDLVQYLKGGIDVKFDGRTVHVTKRGMNKPTKRKK